MSDNNIIQQSSQSLQSVQSVQSLQSLQKKRVKAQIFKCNSIIQNYEYDIHMIDIELFSIKNDNVIEIDDYIERVNSLINKRNSILDIKKSIELEIQTYMFQLEQFNNTN